MKPSPSATPWQPLTFGGVAAFAQGSWLRSLQVQAATGLLVAASLLWLFFASVVPAIDGAIGQLPDQARIQNGRLVWDATTPSVLGATPLLAIAANTANGTSWITTSEFEVLLTPESLRLRSWVGGWTIPYRDGWSIDLSRGQAEAWWGAWRRPMIVALSLGLWVGFPLCWTVLGLVFAVPVRVWAGCLGRPLPLGSAAKLAASAFLPGALVMCGALALYCLQEVPFVGLLLAWIMHVLLGILYLLVAPFHLPRHARGSANPFDAQRSGRRASRKSVNPFGGSR